MIRTLISIDPEEKAWLDHKARELGVPMTAVVREAVARYRVEESRRGKGRLAEALEQTRGLWRHGDGAAWQRKQRDEWDSR